MDSIREQTPLQSPALNLVSRADDQLNKRSEVSASAPILGSRKLKLRSGGPLPPSDHDVAGEVYCLKTSELGNILVTEAASFGYFRPKSPLGSFANSNRSSHRHESRNNASSPCDNDSAAFRRLSPNCVRESWRAIFDPQPGKPAYWYFSISTALWWVNPQHTSL